MSNRKVWKKMIKIVGGIGGLCVALVFVKTTFFPPSYGLYSGWSGIWNPPLEWQFSFCKYELPATYEFVGFHKGAGLEYEKELLFYRSSVSGQGLILLKLREHPKVDLEKVRVMKGKIKKTINYSFTTMEKEGVQMQFLFPEFMITDISSTDNDLILKGDALQNSPEFFETERTKVFYVRGSFTQLGFYKSSKSWLKRYPVPVINFYTPQEGAVAVIKSKQTYKKIIVKNRDGIIPESKLEPSELRILDTLSKEVGETIFAIGYIDEGKEFNEEEFKQIVKSITFDAVFPGGKILEMATPKSSQFSRTTATHQIGPFKWKTETVKRREGKKDAR